ncbi:hypothetical protein JL107_11025 [Nakamurella flavida]|uniref:Uncharacterized protein n=1 Tax=Nakamurella flavida TaxID=363630 RepID=A0A938YQ91_9ACTN|nr:hypothetical protein [Nakamurella flavida]MBM9476980.1 hypothetical protein [Nakamurella flavida]MDP9779925.1 putative membrane protein [Nakamurella flavida]
MSTPRPSSPRDRALAVALWAVIGAFVGVAAGIWIWNPAAMASIGLVAGALYGFRATRDKVLPEED